jgi:hypothetical protein
MLQPATLCAVRFTVLQCIAHLLLLPCVNALLHRGLQQQCRPAGCLDDWRTHPRDVWWLSACTLQGTTVH